MADIHLPSIKKTMRILSTLSVLLLICLGNVYGQTPVPPAKAKTSATYILFDRANADLNKLATTKLDSIYKIWKDSFEFRMYLFGNTDSVGRHEFNEELAHRRVRSVLIYFSQKGMDTNWIKSNSYGEAKPKYENDSLHLHMNRRVDVIIRYGLAKHTAKPVVEAKKVEKKIVPVVAKVEPVQAPQQPVDYDTSIISGSDFELKMSISLYKDIAKLGCSMYPIQSSLGYGGVRVMQGVSDYECMPKSVRIRLKIGRELIKEELDTLPIFDLDKVGNRRRLLGKIRQERKKDGFWLSFRTKCFGADAAGEWWGNMLSKSCQPMIDKIEKKTEISSQCAGNFFTIQAPSGYTFSKVEIKKSRKGAILYEGGASQSSCYVDLNTWKDFEEAYISITAIDKEGKEHHIKNIELSLLSHNNLFKKNIRKEASIYIRPYFTHKDPCRRGIKVFGLRVDNKGVKWEKVKNEIPRKFKVKDTDFED
jgi:hypothetical protein